MFLFDSFICAAKIKGRQMKIIRWIFDSSAFKKKQKVNEIKKKLNEIIILDRFETKGFVNKTEKVTSPKGSEIASNDAI
jgi:hypothetical protein